MGPSGEALPRTSIDRYFPWEPPPNADLRHFQPSSLQTSTTTRRNQPSPLLDLKGGKFQLFLRLKTFRISYYLSPRSPPLPLPLLPRFLGGHHRYYNYYIICSFSKFLSSKGEFHLHLVAFKTSLVENKHKCSPSTNPLRHSEQARMKSMGDCKSTNLGRDRLRSVDRNNKTTLLLTRRCGTNKSYAKDLSPRMVKLQDVS